MVVFVSSLVPVRRFLWVTQSTIVIHIIVGLDPIDSRLCRLPGSCALPSVTSFCSIIKYHLCYGCDPLHGRLRRLPRSRPSLPLGQ